MFYSDSYPMSKQSLYRTPSAPLATFGHPHHIDNRDGVGQSPPTHFIQVPVHELFKPSELHWADVASNTGIFLIYETFENLILTILFRFRGY